MCLIINGFCPKFCRAASPDPDLATDPTDPAAPPRAKDDVRVPLPERGSCLSAARAASLCSAASDIFRVMHLIELGYVHYWNGAISECEAAYDEAIAAAQGLTRAIAQLEEGTDAHVAWQNTRQGDAKDEDVVRAVNEADVSELLLSSAGAGRANPHWESVVKAVAQDGTAATLRAGRSQLPALRNTARDLLASLSHARDSIRQARLFELLPYRTKPTFLETTMLRLTSTVFEMFGEMNAYTALERAAAKRKYARD
jgi:hypothetical protein